MDEDTRRAALACLQREVDLGLEVLPRLAPIAEPDTAVSPTEPSPALAQPAPVAPAAAASPEAPRSAVAGLSEALIEPAILAASDLDELRSVLGECDRCKLCSGRTNIVFGVGNPSARLMFVGEGPGQDEDAQGIPFVGRAGELLTDIIQKGMGLRRDEVYIANIVKCRPPNNRNPEPDEIVACEPFLARQVALVRPEVVVTLGKFASQALLRNPAPISRQRGEWQDYGGTPVMATFHPAYLLRNPSGKRIVWQDIQAVMARLGLSRPSQGAAG